MVACHSLEEASYQEGVTAEGRGSLAVLASEGNLEALLRLVGTDTLFYFIIIDLYRS